MTLEQLNVIRKGNGQEPLDKLPEELGGAKADAGNGAAKTAEEIEAERVAAEAAKKEEKPVVAPVATTTEPTDEELLAILEKRGVKATSLDELIKKEPVDPAKAAEQREAAELAFGLSGGHFSKKEYDQFAQDFEDPQDLVYGEFHAETKAANPEMTDEDIEAEFLATYGLDKPATDYQHKRGVKLVKERAASLLKSKHSKIFTAKDAFTKSEQDTVKVAESTRKVAAALPAYKRDVDEFIGELKKITIKVSDEDSIDIEDNDELLTGIKEQLLDPAYYSGKLAGGYDKGAVKQAVVAGFLAKNFTALSVKVAKKYYEKHKAGTHGVPAGGAGGAKVVNLDGLTENQKKMVELSNAEKAKKAVTN